MRIANWFFLVSVALFITGIGFVVAGAREARRSTPEEEVVVQQVPPLATVKQLMDGMIAPASTAVFDAVSTIVDADGIHENQPRTDEEWAKVGASAASLVESANLLMMGTRPYDQGDWMKMSRAMADAGMEALKASEAKSAEGVLAAGETIYAACTQCHEKYQR